MAESKPIYIPEKCLLLLVGANSSGKTSFAETHFPASALMTINEQEDNSLISILARVEARLAEGLLTVIDAKNLNPTERKQWVQVAKKYHLYTYALVLNPSLASLKVRHAMRDNQPCSVAELVHQHHQVRQFLSRFKKERIRNSHELRADQAGKAYHIAFSPMPSNFKQLTGPFDLIGDVHGCLEELLELLQLLGYQVTRKNQGEGHWDYQVQVPAGRMLVFVGDLVDRGPDSPGVLRLVMSMVAARQALCVTGNHDDKLRRYLSGSKVSTSHGLAETIEQLGQETPIFRQEVRQFLEQLPLHVELDEGRLLVAHAGLRQDMHGRVGGAVRSYCLYGPTTGKLDENKLPERQPWAKDYEGETKIVYGHTPTLEPRWYHRTLCLDTGCVFGHELTALRYPEDEFVRVPAKQTYSPSKRPPAIGSPSL